MPDTILDQNAEPVLPPEDEDESLVTCECCGESGPENEFGLHPVVTGYNLGNRGAYWSRMATVEYWCDSCFENDTVHCSEWRSDSVLVESHGWVSGDYARNNLYYWEGDCEYHLEPEEESEDDEEGLLNYSADVLDLLGWPSNSPRGGLVFGVELEMEGKANNYSRDIVELLGGSMGTKTGCAILKHDGSLRDGRGVELVTRPYTLEYHQQSGIWQQMLDSRLQAAAKSGVGTDNCGIHVHINRAPLSSLTVGKMVVFLNNPENSAFVTTVAQRRSGGYCQRDERKKHGSVLNPELNSRYDIINVTSGNTVEVRMFKGNLRPERVLKNIEFCHALVMFCQQSGITEAQRWGSFVHWLSERRKVYPNLCGFLMEKDYLGPGKRQAPVTELADA